MKTQLAYCSACDQDVRIVVTDEPSADGQANIVDAEVVCLEIGAHCTGALCPVGATSPTVMAARLVRNGLYTAMHPIVKAQCARCEGKTEFVVIDTRLATCTVCGLTAKREELQMLS